MKAKAPKVLFSKINICCALALFYHLVNPVYAQVGEQEEQEAVFELSPFEVETSGDVGYLAQNSLAGSRLNSDLKDIGAAVSVLTEEFIGDLGATSMKDVILYSSNSLPEFGDSATNYNGNPMIGNEEWLVRIRGLEATYMRNYWKWGASSDFYNVSRIDQSRGPNSILFGFGAAGGIVNVTTKQASLDRIENELSASVGSWDRRRGTLDWNQVIVKDQFALRLNTMAEDSESWREHESYEARRVHLAGTWRLTDRSTLRGEVETGEVNDNVSRTWLAIDQAWQWREDGRPTYDGPQWAWPVSDTVTQTWSPHIVYIANDGSIMDWQNQPFTYLAGQSWAHLEMTPENLEIIPRDTNLAGPGAMRDNDYVTYSLVYENRVSENLSFEVAYNHQYNDFLGYDADSGAMSRYGFLGSSSNLWGDAANWLPAEGNWAANPYAGQLYVENNWTRRNNTVEIDNFRATGAYVLDLGSAGRYRLAAMAQRTYHESYGREDAEAWLGAAFGESWDSSRNFAEFDSNRVFRRYYFEGSPTSEKHVPSWETPLTYTTDSGTYESGWVPNQEIHDSDRTQDTYLFATQAYFLEDRLVAMLGFRHDRLDEKKLGDARNGNGEWITDEASAIEREIKSDTTTLGLVYHLTSNVSLFANTSNSRNLPSLRQRIIGLEFVPLPKGIGSDMGIKLDLLEGKLFATINYYTTDYENLAEWGNIGTDIRDRNNNFLQTFTDFGLITEEERDSRWLDANSYLEDRESKGWELEVIANPLPNWRITANFSINEVIKSNIMPHVRDWAEGATAYWLDVAGPDFNFGGGDWDVLSNHIGWMMDNINREVAFTGKQARGQRKYGASFYTRYSFVEGPLEGFSIGGGMRYQSPNSVNYYFDSIDVVDGVPVMTNGYLVEGETMFLADLLLAYEFEMKWGTKPVGVDLQLNISNLFDSDKDQLYDAAWWDSSRAARIGLQEPRRINFTATFSF
jgi:outer membrane receptor for monomeric catechols